MIFLIDDKMQMENHFWNCLHSLATEQQMQRILLEMETLTFEAESIAYIVSNALSLDTSEYSFGYIAGWSKNKGIAELKQSLVLIEQTSKSILKWITDNTELQLVS